MSFRGHSAQSSHRLSNRLGGWMTYIRVESTPGPDELTHGPEILTPQRFRGRSPRPPSESADTAAASTSTVATMSISMGLGIEPRIGDRVAIGDLSGLSSDELLVRGSKITGVTPSSGRYLVEVER